MKKILFHTSRLAILSVLMLSCNNYKLGGNYYILPGYESRDVGYSDGGIIYRSTQMYSFDSVIIGENVIDANSNDLFIVASQDTLKNIEPVLESKILYYIIQKKGDIVYGPLNKQEYYQKRINLKVPESLQLENRY